MNRKAGIPHNTLGRQKAVRFIALVLCTLFIAASLFSAAYILTHADHVHDFDAPDGGCAVCEHMQAAADLLKNLTMIAATAAVAAGIFFASLSFLKSGHLWLCSDTPVDRKVRMNN